LRPGFQYAVARGGEDPELIDVQALLKS
jgi:hypothetical protein